MSLSSRSPGKASLLWLGALLGLLAGCSEPHATPPATPSSQRAGPLVYSFPSLDARPVDSESLRGRATLFLFLTTFGDSSLLEATIVRQLVNEYRPPIQAVAIFMDPPENEPLTRLFSSQLSLPFRSALADTNTISGQGPFGEVGVAPSIVILNAAGVEAWRHNGMASKEILERALRSAQRQ